MPSPLDPIPSDGARYREAAWDGVARTPPLESPAEQKKGNLGVAGLPPPRPTSSGGAPFTIREGK